LGILYLTVPERTPPGGIEIHALKRGHDLPGGKGKGKKRKELQGNNGTVAYPSIIEVLVQKTEQEG
jgi:hypothetical protein